MAKYLNLFVIPVHAQDNEGKTIEGTSSSENNMASRNDYPANEFQFLNCNQYFGIADRFYQQCQYNQCNRQQSGQVY